MASVLQAVADGDIVPNEANSIAGLVDTYRKMLKTMELEEHISVLEAEMSGAS